MTVLLITLFATAVMAGVSWFVSVVHHPLFAPPASARAPRPRALRSPRVHGS